MSKRPNALMVAYQRHWDQYQLARSEVAECRNSHSIAHLEEALTSLRAVERRMLGHTRPER